MHVYLLIWWNFILVVHCQNQFLKNCSSCLFTDNGRIISYTIQRNSCGKLNRSAPSEPVKSDVFDWFVDSKSQKIGLNISWNPEHISSIKYLRGYLVNVWSLESLLASRYFCLNDTLKSIQLYTFRYDCFGYEDNLTFYPNQTLRVEIQSLPRRIESHNDLTTEIYIPKCGDNAMLDKVYECIQLLAVNVTLNRTSCSDRSATVDYLIPSLFNNTISANVSENGSSDEITKWQDLSLNGSVVIKLNSSYNLHDNYTFSILVKNDTYKRSIAIDFKHCLTETEIILYALSSFVAILVIVFIIIVVLARKKKLKLAHHFCKICAENSTNHINWFSLGARESDEPSKAVTLYLVYVNDSDGHRDVVLSFAEFLENFGFKVIFELYQTNRVYDDPVSWMDTSLAEADKVFVIWSPGAAERWQKYSKVDDIEQDYFTPVVKNIYNDLFRGNNLYKFVFVYFEYCSQDVVPVEFIRSYSPFHFRLMGEFKNLYLKVKGFLRETEKTVNLDEEIHSRGEKLFQNIEAMCDYVASNPCWFKEHECLEDINVDDLVFANNHETFHNLLQIIPPSFEDNQNVTYSSSTCNAIKPIKPKKRVTINLPTDSDNSVTADDETSGINSVEISTALTTDPFSCNRSVETSGINTLEISNSSITGPLLNSQEHCRSLEEVDLGLFVNQNSPDPPDKSRCNVIPAVGDSSSDSSAYLNMVSDTDLNALEICNVSNSVLDSGPEKVPTTFFRSPKTVTFHLSSFGELHKPNNSLLPGTASPVLNKRLNPPKSNVNLCNEDALGDEESNDKSLPASLPNKNLHQPQVVNSCSSANQVNKIQYSPEVAVKTNIIIDHDKGVKPNDKSLSAIVSNKNLHQPQVVNPYNVATQLNEKQISPEVAVKTNTNTGHGKDVKPNDKSLFAAITSNNLHLPQVVDSCSLAIQLNTKQHSPRVAVATTSALNKDFEPNDMSLSATVPNRNLNLPKALISCNLISESNDGVLPTTSTHVHIENILAESKKMKEEKAVFAKTKLPNDSVDPFPVSETVDSNFTQNALNSVVALAPLDLEGDPRSMLKSINDSMCEPYRDNKILPPVTLAPIDEDVDPMATFMSINGDFQPIKSCANTAAPIVNLKKDINPLPTTSNRTFTTRDNDSNKPSVALAPIQLDCDPMKTFMSINMSCSTMQQQQI